MRRSQRNAKVYAFIAVRQMKQAVDREKVRMLVADVGYNEASQRLNIPAPTLRQWAHRGKWNVPARTDERVTLVTKPIADAHAEALQDLEGQTRLSLARATRQVAQEQEQKPNIDKLHKAAQTMAIVHRQDQGKGEGKFTLNVLNMGALEITARAPDSAE